MTTRPRSKLAVILHADVVGSTELVQRDESVAHERIRDTFRRLSETIAAHEGTTNELRGDALVAQFERASGAVSAALAFQSENAKHNEASDGDIRPEIRIGIALGEVVIADGTVTGAGVVLAQRLEQLADSGGVVVQGAVSEAVPARFRLEYESLGEQRVKGFEKPVRAFSVRGADDGAPPGPRVEAATGMAPAKESSRRASIAILPFDNLSNDPEQEYFSDGITEDIITDLSKVSGLFVIARNSSFAYRGKSINVSKVSKELGVRYVLEGSVRRAGNRVRVTAQLIDGQSDGHVWAERYDRDLDDIFAVQDELVREIVRALSVELTRDERTRLVTSTTANPEAYDYFLRGRDLAMRPSPGTNEQAKILLERVIELSPDFAPAYAMLAVALNHDFTNAWVEQPREALNSAYDLARKAVELDDLLPQAHWVLAVTNMWLRRLDAARRSIERAIELDASLADGHATLGLINIYAGRAAEALEPLGLAMRLDPHYNDIFLHFLGLAYFMLDRYEESAETLRRRLIRRPDTDISRVLLAAAYGHLGTVDEAREQWTQALRINPRYSLEQKREALPFANPADFDKIPDGLRKAGLPR